MEYLTGTNGFYSPNGIFLERLKQNNHHGDLLIFVGSRSNMRLSTVATFQPYSASKPTHKSPQTHLQESPLSHPPFTQSRFTLDPPLPSQNGGGNLLHHLPRHRPQNPKPRRLGSPRHRRRLRLLPHRAGPMPPRRLRGAPPRRGREGLVAVRPQHRYAVARFRDLRLQKGEGVPCGP